MEAPAVKQAFDKVAAACQRRGIPMIVSADTENVNERLQKGFKMFTIGSDNKPSTRLGEVYKQVHERNP